MKILALDSGQKSQSFCLAEMELDNDEKYLSHKVLTSYNFEGKSSELIQNIKEHFIAANQNVHEINLLAVNIGPGSFTGIRNALSIVKTLSLELKIPVFISNSFDLLRFEHKLNNDESICIPAFKGNFFISEIKENLTKNIKNEYFSFNNPIERVYEYIRENTSELIVEYYIAKVMLAKPSLSEKSDIIDYKDIEDLEPYYLREPSVGKKC
ncbi:MAG: tRNA (adenosine(37)-N6)-threonylcarbamoyltransferase complex dimerization subunit type 1 TsaB [Candidatus Caenarcaniphilales bacterium]|nr:tRNA (adenosine(37)-N6)-threonylcarbamoyltransferase complex dimerization subunit type 1 TsaB [Candidatus Caenarcaniphilales bacterium]